MGITRTNAVRPPHAVFTKINMHGGDKTVCWEWLGLMSPNPIFCWRGKRWQARRMVYTLRKGIPYEQGPKRLVTICHNDRCCNPDHIIPEKGIVRTISRRLECQ